MQGHRRFFLHPLPPPLSSSITSVFRRWNFHQRVQVEPSGIYARNVSFESNLIESLVSLLESVSYFFLKERTKNTFHYYLRNTCQSNHHFSFLLKEKKIYIYIYILLPNFFDSKIERIAKSHPIDRKTFEGPIPLTAMHEWNRSHDSHWGLVERDSPRINMRRRATSYRNRRKFFLSSHSLPLSLSLLLECRWPVSSYRSIDRWPAN